MSDNNKNNDSLSLMAVQEALQDPFQQGNQNVMDSKHLGEINPEWGNKSDWNKATKKFSFVSMVGLLLEPGYATVPTKAKMSVKNEGADDPDKIFRTYPSFDPVFMKI